MKHNFLSSNIQELVFVVIKIDRFNRFWCSCWSCWSQRSLHCLLSRFEKRDVFCFDWLKTMTFLMICDFIFVTVSIYRMFWEIIVRMKWIKISCNWIIIVKSWNADSMMSCKSTEEYKIILKARENFSKNKRIINIYDDFF